MKNKLMYIGNWITFTGALFTPSFLLYMEFELGNSFLGTFCSFFAVCCMFQMDYFKRPFLKN